MPARSRLLGDPVLRFLFTSGEGGGNVTSTREAAGKPIRRGHEVGFMSEDCRRVEIETSALAEDIENAARSLRAA